VPQQQQQQQQHVTAAAPPVSTRGWPKTALRMLGALAVCLVLGSIVMVPAVQAAAAGGAAVGDSGNVLSSKRVVSEVHWACVMAA
jgi:predicted lipid-binding transport protein (Tim44 family)